MADMKLLTSYEIFDYSPDQIKESRERNDGKILMKGILQKADTLNQNGRVYPLHILEREVRNYQKFVLESRALGECVPPGTEIFTRDGWKNIEDISDHEMIFTLNVENNALELQRITQKVVLPFDGNLYRFKNHGTYDMCLTPNHKVLTWDRASKPVTMTAKDLFDAYQRRDSKVSHSSLRRAGAEWSGESSNKFTLLGDGLEIDTQLWAAYLGIYLAEGHSSGVKKIERQKCHQVILTQKDENVQKCIESLLSKLPFDYTINVRADDQTKDYVIQNEALHKHLVQLGSSTEKYVPLYAKSWDKHTLQVLLDWMLMGDGQHRKNPRNEIIPEYCTTSIRLAHDVEEIMIKLGHGATIHTDEMNYDRQSPDVGRMILAENSSPMHIVYQHSSNGMSLDFRFMCVEEIPYKGDVFCVTVSNGTWLMRYNGKVCWTHNCDHPDSSVVNLKNVSHVFKEVSIENGVVYGQLELLNTPSGKIVQSLVESGVKLGISSRGVGTTKKQGDYQVVQDDFQLICFDVVSEPSTTQAFILPEGKTITTSELRSYFTRSDRIDRILNDILQLK